MMRNRIIPVLACLGILLNAPADAEQLPACPPAEGVALQVLGSGGPMADDARSSTSYVIWLDGQSRALIDVGGGSFLRFGEAGADFAELDFVGLSHFHTDHSADFVTLLKSGYFGDRSRPLPVGGPDGSILFPGLHQYLAANLDKESGAYRYLGGYLDGSGDLARLVPFEIQPDSDPEINLLADFDSELSIYAQHVPHGIVPAVAFRVEVRRHSVVFSSDQNGSDPTFVDFARNATLLVMHMPIPESATGSAVRLHAIPSQIGKVANETGARYLLLSHFMARSLAEFDESVSIVDEAFSGNLLTANDFTCISFD